MTELAATKTTETATHVLYSCSRCKHVERHSYSTVVETSYYWRHEPSGFKSMAQRTRAIYQYSSGASGESLPSLTCPSGCGALQEGESGMPMQRQAIKGTVNMAKQCSAKCMAATGPTCECSCGGDNHGGRYSSQAVAV